MLSLEEAELESLSAELVKRKTRVYLKSDEREF
jgi:hypothetical protein